MQFWVWRQNKEQEWERKALSSPRNWKGISFEKYFIDGKWQQVPLKLRLFRVSLVREKDIQAGWKFSFRTFWPYNWFSIAFEFSVVPKR